MVDRPRRLAASLTEMGRILKGSSWGNVIGPSVDGEPREKWGGFLRGEGRRVSGRGLPSRHQNPTFSSGEMAEKPTGSFRKL